MESRYQIIEALPFDCQLAYIPSPGDELDSALAFIQRHPGTWAIDIETMAKPGNQPNVGVLTDPKTADIRTVQLCCGETYSYVFDCKHTPDLLKRLAVILKGKKLLAHNAKFELSFLEYNGIPVDNIGCTMLMRKILHRAEHVVFDTGSGVTDGGLYDYGFCVHHYFGVDLSKEIDHTQWGADQLNFEQLSYAALDVHYLWHMGEMMAKDLVAYGFAEAYKLQKAAQHPVVSMEREGVVFDQKKHQIVIDGWKAKMLEARKEFYARCEDQKVRISKPKDVREYLALTVPEDEMCFWPVTPTGAISLQAHVLQEYMHIPVIASYAVFNKYKSLLSKYGSKMRDHVSPISQRIHTAFNLCGAVTGRMSSKQPNLQNMPRGKDMRELFTAPLNEAIICADYGQIELRVAAILSGDPVMLDAYETGKDIHTLTASGTAGVPYEDVTKEQRTAAKALNFGLIYGMGWKKFIAHAKWNYNVTFEEDEAKDAIEKFRQTYAGYYAWQIRQGKICEKLCYSDTVLGHRRALDPDFTYTAGINHPIQGSAGHVLLRALIRLDYAFRRNPSLGARLCLTVHDEISCYCPLAQAPLVKRVVEDQMIKGFLDIFPSGSTRDLVEAHIGPDWNAAK